MKSTKVVNKILLISLACGSVALVAGILLGKKALVGAGATASVVGAVGVLANGKNKESDDNLEYQQLDEYTAAESPPQDVRQQELLANKSKAVESLEADNNYVPEEPGLLSDIIADSNEPEKEFELEADLADQQEQYREQYIGTSPETQPEQNSRVKNKEELEQIISPIEENVPDVLDPAASFTNSSLEYNNFHDDTVSHSEADKTVETEINPFAASSDILESESDENNNESVDLEIAEKLFGEFDPTEADESDPFQDADAAFDENDDELLIEETEEGLYPDAETAIAFDSISGTALTDDSIAEIDTEAEATEKEFSFEAMPESEPENSTEELVLESETESLEMEFDAAVTPESTTENDLAIAPEKELTRNEFGFDTPDDESSELSLETESLDDEPNFDSSIESDSELNFIDRTATFSETETPEDNLDFDTSDNSIEELSFDSSIESDLEHAIAFDLESSTTNELNLETSLENEPEPELALETESFGTDEPSFDASLEAKPQFTDETETSEDEFSFDTTPVSESDDSIDELNFNTSDDSTNELDFDIPTEESDEPAFNIEDEPAIASAIEASDDEFSLEDEPTISHELDASEDEFSFDTTPVAESDDSTNELSFDPESEATDELDFDIPTEESDEPAFNIEDEPAIASAIETSDDELSFDTTPVAESDDSTNELSFDSESEATDELDFDIHTEESDEPAIASATETSESEFSFDTTPVAESDDSIDELNFNTSDDSTNELSFDSESEATDELDFDIPTEESDEPAFNFDATPLVESDESTNEFSLETESSSIADELSFDTSIQEDSQPELSFTNDEPEVFTEAEMSEDEFSFDFNDSVGELNLESKLEDRDEDEPAIAFDAESSDELSLDSIEEEGSESTEIDFQAMPVNELIFEVEDESGGFDLDDSDELSFEAMPMSESSNLSGEISLDEPQPELDLEELAMPSNEDAAEEFDLESVAETTTESIQSDDFMGQFIEEDRSDDELNLDGTDTINNLELNNESAIISDADDFEFNFDSAAETEDSSADLKFEEFSFEDPSGEELAADDVFAELDLEDDSAIASESDEFMNESVDDNESALDNLDLESAENESTAEFNFDNTDNDDSAFDDLMGAFEDDNSAADNSSSDTFELKFEDEELSELNSLDAVDKKLDELTEISDDSLEELNDLLGSIQDDPSAEQKLNEVHRDK